MKKINVLIVDDSAFIRRMIKDILSVDDEINVVGFANNGKEAIDKLLKNDIDVLTLDVEMPIMDGITTLENIMKIKPTPIIMLSSLTKSGVDLTIQALNLGAVDFITKPSNIFKIKDEDIKLTIIDKIKVTAKVKNFKNYRKVSDNIKMNNTKISKIGDVENIVAIGTSTGGPRALQEVITNISQNINAPIVIVQHMPPGFTKSLADRLNNISRISVKEASDGDVLQNGVAYIAPGDKHMKFKKVGNSVKIILDDSEKVSGHKPSVDAMFLSLADINFKKFLCVVMTGMGSDGLKGVEKLKQNKAVISIAEDESTCIVYGMPKSIVNANLADKTVPLYNIANEINKFMGV